MQQITHFFLPYRSIALGLGSVLVLGSLLKIICIVGDETGELQQLLKRYSLKLCHFVFSKYIAFTMYLNVMYISRRVESSGSRIHICNTEQSRGSRIHMIKLQKLRFHT